MISYKELKQLVRDLDLKNDDLLTDIKITEKKIEYKIVTEDLLELKVKIKKTLDTCESKAKFYKNLSIKKTAYVDRLKKIKKIEVRLKNIKDSEEKNKFKKEILKLIENTYLKINHYNNLIEKTVKEKNMENSYKNFDNTFKNFLKRKIAEENGE